MGLNLYIGEFPNNSFYLHCNGCYDISLPTLNQNAEYIVYGLLISQWSSYSESPRSECGLLGIGSMANVSHFECNFCSLRNSSRFISI